MEDKDGGGGGGVGGNCQNEDRGGSDDKEEMIMAVVAHPVDIAKDLLGERHHATVMMGMKHPHEHKQLEQSSNESSKFSKIRRLVAKTWAVHWTVAIIFLLILVVVTWLCLLSMGQNPLEYVEL